MRKVEMIEEWGKIGGRPYYCVFVYKKDKRYRSGRKKFILKAEWLDELPYKKYDL